MEKIRQLCETLVGSNSDDFLIHSTEDYTSWQKGFDTGKSHLAKRILELLNDREQAYVRGTSTSESETGLDDR